MKKIIQNTTLGLFLFLCNFLFSQIPTEDLVHLKNGSVIRGIIIENMINQSIKIQTADRSIWVFKYEEIEKITKENLVINKQHIDHAEGSTFKKSGFINLVEISYSRGIADVNYGYVNTKNGENNFGCRMVNGYQFDEHLSLGLGIGVEKQFTGTTFPVTLDTRVTFMKGKVSPVLAANIGYAFGLLGIGGLVLNPQLGIKTYCAKNVAYFFNVVYKLETVNGFNYYGYSSLIPPINLNLQFITFSTGFVF
jgi:hypothetical protein